MLNHSETENAVKRTPTEGHLVEIALHNENVRSSSIRGVIRVHCHAVVHRHDQSTCVCCVSREAPRTATHLKHDFSIKTTRPACLLEEAVF